MCAVHHDLSLGEALHLLGLQGRTLPSYVTSVTGAGDTIEVVADPRRINRLPAPVRLAARVSPAAKARLRVVEQSDGVATLGIEATVGGLPAHQLLSLVAGRVDAVVADKGLPAGAVRVLPGARVQLDVGALLQRRTPGVRVTSVAFRDGRVLLDGAAA